MDENQWIEVTFIFISTALFSLQRVSDDYLICTLVLRLRRDKEIPPKPLITAM